MISTTPQGQIIDGPEVRNVWFTDGYADYIRHFMRADRGGAGVGAPQSESPDRLDIRRQHRDVRGRRDHLHDGRSGRPPRRSSSISIRRRSPWMARAAPPHRSRRGRLDVRRGEPDAQGQARSAGNVVRISARASGPDTLAPASGRSPSSGTTHATATISWMTDEPADSQVEYGLTPAYGQVTPLNPARTTSHALSCPG